MIRYLRLASNKLRMVMGLDNISMSRLPPDAANRLRRRQMRGAIEQMQVFVVGNTFFAPVLALQAWGFAADAIVVAWTMLMLVFSWRLFWIWRATYQTDGKPEDMDKFVNETKVNASIWCLGMVLFFPNVTGDEKTVLLCVMIGSLALGTVGFSHAPRASFWYLGIQASTLISVPTFFAITAGNSQNYLLGILALVASVAIFNTVLERAKAQMRAFLDHEELAQKTEVVDLLLKDYEEQATEWLWQTNANGALISCPEQVKRLLVPEPFDGELRFLDVAAVAVAPEGQEQVIKIGNSFSAKTDLNDVTLPFNDPETGLRRWIAMKGRPQFEGETFKGFRGIFADATATMEAKKHIEFLARHDPLTGLYNRNYLQAGLDRLSAENERFLLFLIDLDGFKQVNDSYGHAMGDELLKIVAERISTCAKNASIVARLGGDEFLVLQPVERGQMHLVHDDLAHKLLEAVARPYRIDHLEISVSGSIGTAKFPNNTAQGATLLSYADLALYSAKRHGRNRISTFVPNMLDGVQNRLRVTDCLRKAVPAGAVEPFYQPQFCANSGQLVGAEALARWKDDEFGFVGPDLFIEIAEETGLIHELGERLLRRACLDALNWAPNEANEPLMLAVNLSPVEVMRGNVAKKIKKVLSETGFPPSRLEIEITEGVLIDDVSATRFFLDELSDYGVKIALDDFGTGYSSLSYIRALPLDRLKIDQSFVVEIEQEEAQSIVSTIVGMCERLNLEVVAEGVENREAVEILQRLGCDVLQGYYFSRPLDAISFQEFVQSTQKQNHA